MKTNTIIFIIKVILTILSTALFNLFLEKNFDINFLTMFFFSFIYSICFFQVITKELDIIEEFKSLF